MDKIVIKPHHFLDIIKLYGAGLDIFVPDEKMGHDFYRIGNMILNDKNILMSLTTGKDDICTPCKYCRNGKCIDSLSSIKDFDMKDDYNKALDKRIIEFFNLDLNKEYTSYELCNIYLSDASFIFNVWKEEDDDKTDMRYDYFVKGAKKYIHTKTN